ncbi:MAG: FG-GAP-like repeat-containing protein [Candidatus Sedimenticola sp. (ex Thyasira tokunagai)]
MNNSNNITKKPFAAAILIGLFCQFFVLANASAVIYEWSATSHEILTGDYNNDQLEDIYLAAQPEEVSVTIPYDISINLDLVTEIRDTILLANGDGTYTILYDPPRASIQATSWAPTVEYELEYLDLDGDGNDDLIVKPVTEGKNYIVVSAVDPSEQPVIHDYLGQTVEGTIDPENIPARRGATRPATQTAGLNLDGRFSVSQSGKPNYNLSLKSLPTPGGVRPNLSVAYSGENGDSILGVGWYVSGLSKITRCKTTHVQDSYINGVNFNSSDKFCLNGQRLIAVIGEYGSDGTIYRTENESFTRVVSHGDLGGGPSYFTARKVTGEIEEYGTDDDTHHARKLTSDGARAVSWAINKIADREGNSVTYFYNRNNAEGYHYIDRIVDSKGKIQFTYESRSDVTKYHRDSSFSQLPVRLKAVKNYFNKTEVRSYDFLYSYGGATGHSRLTKARECSFKVCTPYTSFTWDPGTELVNLSKQSSGSDVSSYPKGTVDHQHYMLADVNGDGKSDLIWVYRSAQILGRVIYLANASGTGFTYTAKQEEAGYNVNLITDADHRYLAGDVNGDGKDDLVWVARSQNDLYRVVYLANASGTGFTSQGYEANAFGNLSGYSNANYSLADVNGDGRSDLVWTYVDENTNEFVRTVFLARADSSGKVALGKVSHEADGDYVPTYYNNQNVLTGDVNGDGKADITWMFTHLDKVHRLVYLANPNGTGFTKISAQSDSYNIQAEDLQYSSADVNGDQKSDIVFTYKLNSSNGRVVYLSTVAGTSHEKKESIQTAENSLNHTHRRYSTADLNGDGRSDLVYTYNDGIKFGWKSYTANMDGEGFTLKEHNEYTDTNPTHQNHAYQLGDINGDGKTDLVWTYNTSTGKLVRNLYTLPKSHPDHIVKITDGLGAETDIHYDYLASGAGSFFTKSSGAQYPVRDDNGLSYVVVYTEVDNGIGGKHRYDYTYTGPKTHLTGRGFLGFDKRTITDNETGFVTTETYGQQFPVIGTKQSETVAKANGNPIEKAYYHWKTYDTGLGTFLPYLKDQVALKYDLATQQPVFAAHTTDTYDLPHGNVETSVLTVGGNFSGAIDGAFDPAGTFAAVSISDKEQTITTNSAFLNDASENWRIGFLTDRTVTYSAPDEADRVLQSSYAPYSTTTSAPSEADRVLQSSDVPYSTTTFLTKTESQYLNSGVSLTKTYNRDSYGNITKTTISGDEIEPRSTETTAYKYGIYPNDLTNEKGHKQQLFYNDHTGSLEQKIDANGLITDTLYDHFGRRLLTKDKDGSETEVAYSTCATKCSETEVADSTCATKCPENALYKVTTTVTHPAESIPSAPQTVAYVDKLSRAVRTETKAFDGSTVRTDSVYDARGRLARESKPYIIDQQIPWVDFTYDDLNRVTNSAQPDGGSITTTYSASDSHVTQETTVTKIVLPDTTSKKITTKIERNALGQIKRVVDGESIPTDYKYNAQGHLRWTQIANDPTTDVVITTDVAENRTQLVDPDAGTVNYDYDAAGLLRQVAYADGATVTTTYDTLNRIKTRTDTLGADSNTSSWVYDSSQNGLGRVGFVVAPNVYKKYEYDALSRPKQTATKLFGETEAQSFHYRYDPYSRLKTQEYPDGFKAETRYNSVGYKIEILNADTLQSYWQATAGDQWGNITQETFGNGIKTARQYDPNNGYLDLIKTGPRASSSKYQNLSFGFDTVGNLIHRNSQTGHYADNLVENFVYDNLYRLKSAETTGLQSGVRSLNYNYDNLGNITFKSDVSDIDGYAYGGNGGGIHALSSITKDGQTSQYHYDGRGNMTSAGDRTLTYTPYNKPSAIAKPGVDTQFTYGPDRERTAQLTNNAGRTTDTKYYGAGLYEVVKENSTTMRKAYVGDFLVHTDITVNDIPSGEQTRYLHKDHIGSTDAITDESGTATTRMAFAPFGSRRDEAWQAPSQTYMDALPDLTFNTTTKGFTGHEQLDATGFIHMGGRLYDPAAGRFLSADTYVQFPEFSQSFNRYSYVLNNPLSHRDPSGEIIPVLVWGGVALWRAYSAYDTVTNGVESVKTIMDDNASGTEKAVAAFDLASRVVGVKKVQTVASGMYDKGKKLVNKASNKKSVKSNAKKADSAAPEAKGKDANTQSVKGKGQEKVENVSDVGLGDATKRTPHKNSLDYVGETHVYRVKGPNGNHKIGESAQGTRVRDGASIRTEQQARKLIRQTGDRYSTDIRKTFPDKRSAREYETRLIERFRRRYGQDALPGNKTNR